MGLVALWHVGSSQTMDRTCVPCIGRWILNHCTTREVPECFLMLFLKQASIDSVARLLVAFQHPLSPSSQCLSVYMVVLERLPLAASQQLSVACGKVRSMGFVWKYVPNFRSWHGEGVSSPTLPFHSAA